MGCLSLGCGVIKKHTTPTTILTNHSNLTKKCFLILSGIKLKINQPNRQIYFLAESLDFYTTDLFFRAILSLMYKKSIVLNLLKIFIKRGFLLRSLIHLKLGWLSNFYFHYGMLNINLIKN